MRELLAEVGFEIFICKCENFRHVHESLQDLQSKYNAIIQIINKINNNGKKILFQILLVE